MTKKNFIALADAVRIHNKWASSLEEFGVEHLKVLADFCAAQNPRFNRQRWLDYIAGECGPSGGKVKAAK